MSSEVPEAEKWARAHEARFDVDPLIEMVQGRRAHVGFTVTLSARLPMDRPPGDERRAAAEEIRARLRQVLQSLAPPAGSRARLEIEPPRAAVVLSKGSDWEPEIAVTGRVFHGDDLLAEFSEGEKTKVYEGARTLKALGFKE